MDLEGTICGGVVVPDGPVELANGTRVRIEPVEPSNGKPISPLGQRLLAIAGRARGLPADMARQHDHYIHGAPKQ